MRSVRPGGWRVPLWSAALLLLLPALGRAGFIDHFATDADIGPDKVPHLGLSRVLVIPVIVLEAGLPDEATLLAEATAFYDNQQSGFTFANYYRIASLERYEPLVTIGPTVTFDECPFSRNSQGNCSIARGDLSELVPAIRVVKQILDQIDPTVDFSDYDVNGPTPGVADGHVDGVIILGNIDFGGIALPHWRICQNDIASIACLLAGLASWDSTYDGVLVPFTAIAASRYGDTSRAVYVSVHEFGHLLGFADLYDEDNQSTDLPYSFMGGWNYDAQPQLPSAFSRYVIGWANPVQIGGDGVVTLRPAFSHGDIVKLGSGEEYFLAENRRANPPWDADVQPGGVVIQHVNLAQLPAADDQGYVATIIGSCVNCDVWEPMLMNEQADGLFELQQGTDNRDDAGDLFHTGDSFPTAPSGPPLSAQSHALNSNLYSGETTGIAVTAVDTDLADQLAELTITHPPLADPCADLRCPLGASCVDGVCEGPGEPDAGIVADAGVAVDSASRTDTGGADQATPDANIGPDHGAATDAAEITDAAGASDAAERTDAGPGDGGTTGDSASGDDPVEPLTESGCGCTGASGTGSALLLPTVLGALRRRRRGICSRRAARGASASVLVYPPRR